MPPLDVTAQSGTSSGLPDPALRSMVSLGVGQQMPTRLAAFLAALQQLQAMASGSPQALSLRTVPQMQSLGQAQQRGFRDISSRLGPHGGGQLIGGEQNIRDSLAQQLVPLFTSPVLEAIQQLTSLPDIIKMGRPPTGLMSQGTGMQVDIGSGIDAKGIQGLVDFFRKLPSLFPSGSGGWGSNPSEVPFPG